MTDEDRLKSLLEKFVVVVEEEVVEESVHIVDIIKKIHVYLSLQLLIEKTKKFFYIIKTAYNELIPFDRLPGS